ncbi:hypothetical protein OD350_28755 (plasmid) [Clostridium beijerinckii]|uniref:hypothetical protein n=1 Tax=Clostridium beijerinckii TaxID=1520 RepID=UPI002225E6CB|nr:hypothetical protein [Clostridium beijerinckii]UYZ39065.1 hypothetical protein OD350_28755 [Clostridium beijerinckii]
MRYYTFFTGVGLIALFLAAGWYIFVCKYDNVSLLKIFLPSTIKEFIKDYIYKDKKFAAITTIIIILASTILMSIIYPNRYLLLDRLLNHVGGN